MTQYYVRSSGGSDANGGTSHADGWATIQFALDNMTHAGGNQCNLSGAFVLSASLDGTTFGNDIEGFVFRGYTNTANDGGIASIDGGGNVIWNAIAGTDHYIWRDLKFTNWGTGYAILGYDDFCLIANCEFDGEGARVQAIDMDSSCAVVGCKIHDMASTTEQIITIGFRSFVGFNYIQSTGGVGVFGGSDAIFFRNVISFNSTNAGVVGLELDGDNDRAVANTIFNRAAGAGNGILADVAGDEYHVYLNNIIAGFSGGGVGINLNGGDASLYGFNKFWNNSTDLSQGGGRIPIDLGSNTALGGNPFRSTGNANPDEDDFELSAALEGFPLSLYDPGGLFAGNEGYLDAGALQRGQVASIQLEMANEWSMKQLPPQPGWGAVPYKT